MHHATVGLIEVEVALGDQAHELIHHIRQRDGSLRIADVRALEHRTGRVGVDEHQIQPLELLVAAGRIVPAATCLLYTSPSPRD